MARKPKTADAPQADEPDADGVKAKGGGRKKAILFGALGLLLLGGGAGGYAYWGRPKSDAAEAAKAAKPVAFMDIREMVINLASEPNQERQRLLKFRAALEVRDAKVVGEIQPAVLIELKLDMEGRGGLLQILLPYATIEPIRDLLLQSFMGEKLGRDHVWEGHLATEMWQADIEIEAVLHETRVPLKQVLSLEVGDTLMFDARPSDLVTLRCGDWTLAQGRVGRIDHHIAIQVARPLRRSRTTFAAFEASMKNQRDG